MNIDRETLEQYKSIFGAEKMRSLWNDFIDDAGKKLDKIENADNEAQRLAYHSLHSSSLVFGLKEFAELCTVYEDKVLGGGRITSDEAAASRRMLKQNIAEADTYLK